MSNEGKNAEMKALWQVDDVAKLYGRSHTWVHMRAADGRLPNTLVGRTRVFDAEVIKEMHSKTAAGLMGADWPTAGGSGEDPGALKDVVAELRSEIEQLKSRVECNEADMGKVWGKLQAMINIGARAGDECREEWLR